MSTYPTLKTGAPSQYPLTRLLKCRTHIVRFVDGSEQRFRELRGPLHTWVIGLEILDDAEMQKFFEFVESVRGAAGSFSFRDPVDGSVYSHCTLETDAAEFAWDSDDKGRMQLIVRERTK
jgi:hypothetical protein